MVERFHATPVQPAVPNEECVRASDYDAIAAELAEAETRERHARELCWLLVQAAGGEIRIPDDLIIRMPRDAALETFNTFEFRGQVYRATRLTDSASGCQHTEAKQYIRENGMDCLCDCGVLVTTLTVSEVK